MSITFEEKIARGSLYKKGYEYIDDNFHKLNERNKMKVALAIIQIFAKHDEKIIINNSLTNQNINADAIRQLSADDLRAIVSACRTRTLSASTT